MATLGDLKVGDRGVIASLEGKPILTQRLLEMGLTEGTEVEVIRFAPMGDPMEIRLRGYLLSLRKEDARGILLKDPS